MEKIYKFKNILLEEVNDLNKIIDDPEHYSDTRYLNEIIFIHSKIEHLYYKEMKEKRKGGKDYE